MNVVRGIVQVLPNILSDNKQTLFLLYNRICVLKYISMLSVHIYIVVLRHELFIFN